MARALVIGGTLFIGRALVEQLLERGDDVVIMHRGIGTPFGKRVGEIRCDRNDIPAVQVSAAALVAAAGLRRYVFMSSIAVYGQGLGHDERDPLVRSDDPNEYNRNKAESERALFALQRSRGVPVTRLRPAFIYGPYNPFDREAFFWDRIVAERPIIIPGDGSRPMQWVQAEDVARAAICAAEADVAIGHSYNLGNYPP